MRCIRWIFIIVLSLALHAGLAMAWMFNQPKVTPPPEPMTIAMLAFESPEPAAEKASSSAVVEPEPEPEPEPVTPPPPVVKPAIAIAEKKPEVKPKPKPKPKKEEKREKKQPPKPIENKLADKNTQSLESLNSGKPAAQTVKTDNQGSANSSSNAARGPKALRRQAPSYPERARRLGKEGVVKVRYDIDTDGRITNVEIIEATPKGLFEREVKRAMNRWLYEQKPQPTTGKIVEIRFKIDGTVSQI